MRTITIGIDLAKQVFSICALDATGQVQQRRELTTPTTPHRKDGNTATTTRDNEKKRLPDAQGKIIMHSGLTGSA